MRRYAGLRVKIGIRVDFESRVTALVPRYVYFFLPHTFRSMPGDVRIDSWMVDAYSTVPEPRFRVTSSLHRRPFLMIIHDRS